MEAIEFVTKFRERVIENDNKIYQDLLDAKSEANDPVWKAILPINQNMGLKYYFVVFVGSN